MARPPRLGIVNTHNRMALFCLKKLDPKLALRLLQWYTLSQRTVMLHTDSQGKTHHIWQTYRALDHLALTKLWKRISMYKDPIRRWQLLAAEVRKLDHLSRAANDYQLHDHG